jgi:MFS family permease
MSAASTLPPADFLNWGWRIPFLGSAVLVVVGVFIRLKVAESPEFERVKRAGKEVRIPVLEVLKHHMRSTFVVMGARVALVTWFYTMIAFALEYAANTLGIPKPMILNAITLGAFVSIITMPVFGSLADKIGEKWVFLIAAAAMSCFAVPFFELLMEKEVSTIWWAMGIGIGVVYAMMASVEGPLYSGQFPPEIRYSGTSLSVQLSGAIAGGFTPIIATSLLAAGAGSPRYVCWYLIIVGVIGIICSFFMKAREPVGE